MNREERRLRDAFLAEMWPTCREVSREERAAEKARRQMDSRPVDNRVEKAS